MTKKIFWADPYLTYLKTQINTVDRDRITVNETIFYAFSGGQESDEGTIGGYKALTASKIGKEITYTLATNHSLKPKDTVEIEINWQRRYQLMRLHFAAEVVLEIVYQQFPGLEKIGAHIAENKARIDFTSSESLSPILPILQKQAQALIDSNQPIISAFSDEENERRYWEVLGFARVPCGGTHLKNTSEVGNISLNRVNVGKNKERIDKNGVTLSTG